MKFTGLTQNNCADGCSESGCVISGKPYCAHPAKGGLQPISMSDQSVLARFRDARKLLRMDEATKRVEDVETALGAV